MSIKNKIYYKILRLRMKYHYNFTKNLDEWHRLNDIKERLKRGAE